MSSSFLEKYRNELFFVLTVLCYLIIYFPITLNFELYYLDDSILIGKVFELKYLMKILTSSETVDIQPVRDISYWIDYQLMNNFGLRWGINTAKWANILYWLSACIIFKQFIKRYLNLYKIEVGEEILILMFAVLLLHPAHSFPIGWLSSRKHVLAFTFILLASNEILKNLQHGNGKYNKAIFFFILSVLSHPIYCCWPLWVAMTWWQQKGKSYLLKQKTTLMIFFFIAGCASVGNYIYYKFYLAKYSNEAGIHIPYSRDTLDTIIMAIGRYTINLLNFYGNTTFYVESSTANTFGAIIFLFISIGLYKLRKHSIIKNLSVLFFISSATFILFPLGTFAQNTYAFMFNSCMVITVFCLMYFNQVMLKKRSSIWAILMALFLVGEVAYAGFFAQLWRDNMDVAKHNRSLEEIPYISAAIVAGSVVRLNFAGNFNDKKIFDVVMPEMVLIKKAAMSEFTKQNRVVMSSIFRAYYHLLAYIFGHATLKPEVKKIMAEEFCLDQIIYCNYFRARIQQQLGEEKEVNKYFNKTLDQLSNIFSNPREETFKGDYASRWADILYTIQFYDKKNAEVKSKVEKLIKEVYDRKANEVIKKYEYNLSRGSNYNDERFENKLSPTFLQMINAN